MTSLPVPESRFLGACTRGLATGAGGHVVLGHSVQTDVLATCPPRQVKLPDGHPGAPRKAIGPRPPEPCPWDLASLTRLWLLAEMIFVALGFHRTKSASEPTATRPFLG